MNIKKLLGYALGPIGGAAASAVALPLISWYFPADDIGRIVLLPNRVQPSADCARPRIGSGLYPRIPTPPTIGPAYSKQCWFCRWLYCRCGFVGGRV